MIDVLCCTVGEEEVLVCYISYDMIRLVSTICILILLRNKCGEVLQSIGEI